VRIALITREFPPETAWGGIGSFYANFAKALHDHGHDTEVFCQGLHQGGAREEMPGIPVHRVLPRQRIVGPQPGTDLAGNADLGEFAFSLAWELFQAFFRRHQEKPFDLAEGHEHLGVNALINFLHLPDCRTVTRFHSSYRTLTVRRLVDWPLSELTDRLERQSIVHADCRIATSRFIERVTREDFSLGDEATTVIPNCISCPSGPGNGDDATAKEDLVLFVGRLIPKHKRPDLAAQAFAAVAARFPDWRIEFAGRNMPYQPGLWMWEYCRSVLLPLGEPRFCYHGQLAPPAVQALYRRARIILIPSQFESFGMVATEAMSHGCVPIVTDQTALPDVVGDPGLVCRNGDLSQFTATLEQLMGNRTLWEAKSRACREQARRTFAPEVVLQQNLDLFARLIQCPATSGSSAWTAHLAPSAGADVQQPRISIISPSYNKGQYIEETIRSVLDQHYPNFEHIVVDGGSTDQTLSILRKYPHVRWESEKDLGQAHAINKGLLMATGEIVAYLNADDVYRPGAFTAVAEIFQAEPMTQIIVGDCDYINDASQVTGHLTARFTGLKGIIRYWGWDRWHCIPQQSTFWRKTLLAEVGLFDPCYHFVMDYEMWLRIAARYPFRTLDRTLAGFRLTADTKTVSGTHEMYLEEYDASRRFWNHLELWDRVTTAWSARQHLSTKLIAQAEHIGLTGHYGVLPLHLLLSALGAAPWAGLRPRFWLALGGVLSKIQSHRRVSVTYNKFHRKSLHLLNKLRLAEKETTR
jgi:glycosyltransferase involved in cell wall biosynthesis